ncbi:ImmA/IrrE family metallo-endopeptidase [Sphingorhabdus sp. YGSMI21]|uniref:ImmA/IrrE family metallo-endopeptidase n=1 Tax=Sphingorhabdus sp. YGSMI21 TaxID=2077182 RepID=UPI000C1E1441|nr:ImmA/IrrE family metallo-endopeptidase [Sphingorhabdus sp. YGSMI21]ATW05723.1 hypothetical protein CHN51_18765 [Sphingorhabdus sp. YGSMI21]
MKEPTTPRGWAAFLGKIWPHGFPIDVKTMAMEYSARFPDSILAIKEAEVENFEGALCPVRDKWAILYNPGITSPGRVNFTLAHELGHYLVHRHKSPGGFECGEQQLAGLDRNAARKAMEQEADEFASHILMPTHDFDRQIRRADFTFDLLENCVSRYDVSRTAAALKWVDRTSECAAVVAATNGFVLWNWRSKRARQRGIWFDRGSELPSDSWAASPAVVSPDTYGVRHDEGVWHDQEAVRELAVFAPRHEMTISVLVYENDEPKDGFENEIVSDSFDRFTKRN